MKTLIQQMQDVLNQINQYDDLNKKQELTKFKDKKSGNVYDSLEEAFSKGIKDFSNFQPEKETINPLSTISQMVTGSKSFDENDIQVINDFHQKIIAIANESLKDKRLAYYSNVIFKARKDGDKEKELKNRKLKQEVKATKDNGDRINKLERELNK